MTKRELRRKRISVRVERPFVNIAARAPAEGKSLDLVLKCDTVGSLEAVDAMLKKLNVPGVRLRVIHSGVGRVGKGDLLSALSGSRLVVGFGVGVDPILERWVKERGVEVRLYKTVYTLAEDLKRLAESLVRRPEPEERIVGKARIIALFKTDRGVIIGCEVLEGSLRVGKNFRIIGAMGPMITARIESLQIERTRVAEAKAGQRAGLKISGFNAAKMGDLVESFEVAPLGKDATWRPRGAVLRMDA